MIKKILFTITCSFLITYFINEKFYYNINTFFTDRLFLFSDYTNVDDIIIISIDDKSIETLGKINEWKRQYYTKIFDILKQAKVIGVDILFLDKSSDKKDNEIFINSIKNQDNIILASMFNFDNKTLTNPFYYKETAPINIPIDEDGKVRNAYIYFKSNTGIFIDSFVISIIKKYLNINDINKYEIKNNNYIIHPYISRIDFDLNKKIPPIIIPKSNDNQMYINFSNNLNINIIPFIDVYNKLYDADYFKNKIVLVGAYKATGIQDEQYTPISYHTPMPGILIHAHILNTILNGKYIKKIQIDNIYVIFIISFIIIYLFTQTQIITNIFLFVINILTISTTAILLYTKNGIIFDLFYAILIIIYAFLCSIIFKIITETKEKQILKKAFSYYVSDKIMQQILKNPKKLELMGEEKEICILFCDINNFTSISEKLNPKILLNILNEYLESVSNIILKYDGILDKFIGDSIMAFWGAPIHIYEKEKKVCHTAIMIIEKINDLQKKFKKNYNIDFSVKIGINKGNAIVGNIGSKKRFNYTVIGDTVNTASRIENLNKFYKTNILVTGDIIDTISNNFCYREIDTVIVKGKNELIWIFELFDKEKEKIFLPQKGYWIKGLQYYKMQKFEQAIVEFENIKNDPTTQIYIDRCKYLIKNPPEKDWNAIWIFDTK